MGALDNVRVYDLATKQDLRELRNDIRNDARTELVWRIENSERAILSELKIQDWYRWYFIIFISVMVVMFTVLKSIKDKRPDPAVSGRALYSRTASDNIRSGDHGT